MSIRTIFSRAIQQGIVRNFITKFKNLKPQQTISDCTQPSQSVKVTPVQQNQRTRFFSGLLARYAARNIFGKLHNKSTSGLRAGHLPSFAFGLVGLTLVDKSDEEDSISESVREIFKDKVYTSKTSTVFENGELNLSLDKLDFGKLIGTGCNAAVYEVRMKDDEPSTAFDGSCSESDIMIINEEMEDRSPSQNGPQVEDSGADITSLMNQEVVPCGDDNSHNDEIYPSLESDIVIISTYDMDTNDSFEMVQENSFESRIDVDVIYERSVDVALPEPETEQHKTDNGEFDHAIKMMYNYDIESNSDRIMKAWRKELVPVTGSQKDVIARQNGYKQLPLHPNIVDIHGVFVDEVPALPDGIQNYPMALPERIYPHGHGRNKTMFILMKKYNTTLRDFLKMDEQPSVYTRCLLLTQLLEGVVHLRNHGIAHRDLKSDNILLDVYEDNTPQLVISDFGCCLADDNYGLKIPYHTDEVDRGGIPTLMAPEIACAVPGKNSWLDYDKADLWTVGTLVYELFGVENPFLEGNNKLDCRSYKESALSRFPDEVPDVVKLLTEKMLKRDPKQRASPEDAANIMQIYLWFPDWFTSGSQVTVKTIINDLLILAAKMLISCHGNIVTASDNLKLTFLKRFTLNDVKKVLNI